MAISTRPEIQDRCCRVFSLSAALFHVHRWKHSETFKGASVESILKAIDGGINILSYSNINFSLACSAASNSCFCVVELFVHPPRSYRAS